MAMVSGMFGIIAATRSPSPTPADLIACWSFDTSSRNLFHDQRRSALSSARNTSASPSPSCFRRFSA